MSSSFAKDPSLSPRLFADIEVGDEIGPVTRVPTTEAVKRYAEVTGITDRRFLDLDRAHQTGFHRLIVPGPLSATFLAQMLRDHFVGWQFLSLNTSFRTPIAHGDTLTLWGTVTEKAWQGEMAIVHCDLVAENQQGERAIVGTAVLSLCESKP
jgi:acyl dehydratase